MILLWPHVDALYGAAARLVGPRDRAEECVQETLLRAWKYGGKSFEGAEHPRAWLLAILRNVVSDAQGRWSRNAHASLGGEEAEPPDARPASPASDAAASEIRLAIADLPGEFRDVVLLAIVDGLKYREVAAALGIPIGTVMSRLHRGRSILRERLASYSVEPRRPGGREGGSR